MGFALLSERHRSKKLQRHCRNPNRTRRRSRYRIHRTGRVVEIPDLLRKRVTKLGVSRRLQELARRPRVGRGCSECKELVRKPLVGRKLPFARRPLGKSREGLDGFGSRIPS